MFEVFFSGFLSLVADLGYLGVFFFMAIASSFFPFSSEVVVPPAAFLASKGEMNVWVVILMGTLGSLFGALINYFLGFTLGRRVVHGLVRTRLARYMLLDEAKLLAVERFFERYGGVSTFIGRLIPGVRQLISIPAGFSRMNIWSFCFYTLAGAFVWVSVLAGFGYFLGPDIANAVRFVKLGVLVFVIVIVGYFLWRKFFKGRSV